MTPKNKYIMVVYLVTYIVIKIMVNETELNDTLIQNEHCYRFQYMKNTHGLFHKTIDVTYVVHLEGNGRYESVMKQLNEYHLTNDVYNFVQQRI